MVFVHTLPVLVLVRGKAKRVLILAPKAVLTQWQIELREKFNMNWPIYDGGARMRTRFAFPDNQACRSRRPASMVFPRPTSSAIRSFGGQVLYKRSNALVW